MADVNNKTLAELACFLEDVLDDAEICKVGSVDLTLSIEEVEWLLDQLYFALGSVDPGEDQYEEDDID